MTDAHPPVRAAIVDYGMGNLFSVGRACEVAGMDVAITTDPRDLSSAELVILPGVGAFGDAMADLERSGMAEALRATVAEGRQLWGICLGLQLLFDRSDEMGDHAGLGIIPGPVVRLPQAIEAGRATIKVPIVGWSSVLPAEGAAWDGTPLDVVPDGTWMYFVHSFHARPSAPGVTVAEAPLPDGSARYCAAVSHGNVFATQFHPERSGEAGQRMYRRMAELVIKNREV